MIVSAADVSVKLYSLFPGSFVLKVLLIRVYCKRYYNTDITLVSQGQLIIAKLIKTLEMQVKMAHLWD